jgi:peptide/nickel transport system substrate-binding protein
MPATALRHFAALLLLGATSIGLASCRNQPEGTARVLVIGEAPPKLKDPSVYPLTTADATLLSNVAQGLVAFDARGNIVAGLAERWNVSNDGLSYIFRLAAAEWPDGRKISAHQVARLVKRQLGPRSQNPLKDTLGAVEDVVAMTDRVLEIRLVTPRPNLLPLLAAPQMAILRDGQGTGPFAIAPERAKNDDLRLTRAGNANPITFCPASGQVQICAP